MRVIVDTTIWSFVLRREIENLSPKEQTLRLAFEELVRDGRVVLLGIIRQEILSGVADHKKFEKLKLALDTFSDEPILTIDHVRAAEMYNRCRAKGVQGATVDMLICAIAERLATPIFTTDADFSSYARYVPVKMYEPRNV